jgi:hypothetical protein
MKFDKKFMKQLIALAALPFIAAPAMAGPYVNVEANAGLTGSDYVGTVTEAHVGYEGPLSDTVTGYIQLGPALATPNGGGADVELSGKVGVNIAATDKLSVYGEYWLLTGGEVENLTSNIKAGVKYSF